MHLKNWHIPSPEYLTTTLPLCKLFFVNLFNNSFLLLMAKTLCSVVKHVQMESKILRFECWNKIIYAHIPLKVTTWSNEKFSKAVAIKIFHLFATSKEMSMHIIKFVSNTLHFMQSTFTQDLFEIGFTTTIPDFSV